MECESSMSFVRFNQTLERDIRLTIESMDDPEMKKLLEMDSEDLINSRDVSKDIRREVEEHMKEIWASSSR